MSFDALDRAHDRRDLTRTDKAALTALAKRLNHKNGKLMPSMETLAKDMGRCGRHSGPADAWKPPG